MPVAVDVAVIMCLMLSFPYIITADVPHYSLKKPFLTEIGEPSGMAMIICCSNFSFGWYGSSHI